jgi:hypothetical protein
VNLEKPWDADDGAAAGKGALYVGHRKNETSKRPIPLERRRAMRSSAC